jgi:hypothetical protein
LETYRESHDSNEVDRLQDKVYQGPIAGRWNQAYQRAYEEFEGACLLTLRAFNSNEELKEACYRAFDSVEVLPAALKPKYLILLEKDEPLEASQLLVPVRWRQFHKLQHEGRVERSNHPGGPIIVDAEYNSEFGLVL